LLDNLIANCNLSFEVDWIYCRTLAWIDVWPKTYLYVFPPTLTLTATLTLTLTLNLKHKKFSGKRNDVIFWASVQMTNRLSELKIHLNVASQKKLNTKKLKIFH